MDILGWIILVTALVTIFVSFRYAILPTSQELYERERKQKEREQLLDAILPKLQKLVEKGWEQND